MSLNTKDLLFYNKEGYPINTKWNADLQYWYASLFFDKNSTDTFKTLGIYTFEKIQPSRNTFQAYLDQYQVFNTDGFQAWPSVDGAASLEITDIKKSNNSSAFSTKWVYADGIGRNFRAGDWCYFQGLTGYHGTDFDDIIALRYQAFQVLKSEIDRVLVKTTQNNGVALPTFTPSTNKKIVPINVLEVDTNLGGYSTTFANKVYAGKKLNWIPSTGSDNTGIWTVANKTIARTKRIETFAGNLFTPTAIPALPDSVRLTVDFFTDRLQVSNGTTAFNSGGTITLPYNPSFLKIGDTIQAEQKVTALSGGNTVTFTITGITAGVLDVTPAPVSQTLDCYVYMASNQLVIEQDAILDNNNQYSLPVTYWSLAQQWATVLDNNGLTLSYVPATDSLEIRSKFADTYFDATLTRYNAAGTLLNTYGGTVTSMAAYPHWVSEQLAEQEVIPADSTVYTRRLVFNTIDGNGLNIIINNKLYDVDFDTTVANTTNDWITQHSAELTSLGIGVSLATTTVTDDTIVVTSDYANRPVTVSLNMGDFAVWYVPKYRYEFNNIKTQLLISINGRDYIVPFVTNDATTVANWVTAYSAVLRTLGVVASVYSAGVIEFSTFNPDTDILVSYNIGYIPKSGDSSVFIENVAPNGTGSVLAGNEIKTTPGLYNFINYYSSGQKITISGATKIPQNASYNIIDLSDDTIWLSYQGAFWQQGTPLFDMEIRSDFWIRHPMQGIEDTNTRSKMRWTWKDTQIDEIFLYDLSGSQLTPVRSGFPDYSGPVPLCGEFGEIEVKLNKKPNDRAEWSADPTRQQTVFDKLEFDLPFLDATINPNVEPAPMQTFVGYNQKAETWAKSRLYVELLEDLKFTLATAANLSDNLWTITANTIEVTSPSIAFDWSQLGFRSNQLVRLTSKDSNTDDKNLASLENNGRVIRIKSVMPHKMEFYDELAPETSVKVIGKTTPPYYDPSGNAYTETRRLEVTLTVQPSLLAYFDFYGESEGEDERHKINLDNRNLNILKLQDFYIFRGVDISEKGIDWIFLNRKRKELLEIYPEIFNNVSSYKSIIQAINFFGYNDLTFTEYFQNVNPDSTKFGQLFNMELLNLFNKDVKGWSYSNLAVDSLKNFGYKKTNLFSLNYRITDADGNFVDGFSQEEVRIKLNGLKRWLTENLVPIGAKIVDVNGKYRMPYDWHIKHETYKTQTFRAEEYSVPVNFKVQGYLQPVSPGSNQYNITVKPECVGDVDFFSWRVRTFSLPTWVTSSTYISGSTVYHGGKLWLSVSAVGMGEEPGISSSWSETTIDQLQYVQILQGYRYDLTNWSFTVNDQVDPHFVVELDWHSGHACTWQIRKAYSTIANFFDGFSI